MSNWLIAVAAVFVLYALFSQRLSKTVITGPMVFVTFGLLLGSDAVGSFEVDPDTETVTLLLEVTLAVVLFSDATSINGSSWRKEASCAGEGRCSILSSFACSAWSSS